MIRVVPVPTPGLGDRSYVATDGRVAVVVDPQRDIDRVEAVLDEVGAPAVLVLETHIHNDYVTGGLELARVTGADYGVAAAERVAYPRRPLRDGDRVEAGTMTVLALATPGHTPHHLSYVLLDEGVPVAVFTGGSLLYGTVGRTDLIAPERTEDLTRAQYRSARRLLDELPGEVEVCPTHGFGSFCSSAPAPQVDSSTVERERRDNSAAHGGEDEFVAALLAGLTAYPDYYARMAPINRAGPAPLDLAPPPSADPACLRRRAAAGEWVVDLRERRAFAGWHLERSVNIEGSDQLATYLGWVVPWGAPITLVGEREGDVAEAQRGLARIGIDRLAGRAVGAIQAVAAGQPVGAYPAVGFAELAASPTRRTIVDVRRDDEWAEGHLAGAVHVPLPDLELRVDELPGGELWVHCRSGFRAAIGASLLARAGRRVVLVDDDFEAAAEAGLAIV